MPGRDARLHHADLGTVRSPALRRLGHGLFGASANGRIQSYRGHREAFKMQILIVGIGALGGTIAARAIRTGLRVRLAARNTDSAEALRRSGLRVSGIGGEMRADAIDVAAVEDYGKEIGRAHV